MRRYGLLPVWFAVLVAAASVTACAGIPTLDKAGCVTKVSGSGAFGSVTPTGTWKFSAVCTPDPTVAAGIKVGDIAAPPITQEVPAR